MSTINPSVIKNKLKRQQVFGRQKHLKNLVRHKARTRRRQEEEDNPELRQERLESNQPRTIENTREVDDTIVAVDDQEVFDDEEQDEFAGYFKQGITPKILITTSRRPSKNAHEFTAELKSMIPNATIVKRKPEYDIKHIVEFSNNREYTDIIIVNEDKKQPNALTFIHLPDGPTTYYKLTSIIPAKQVYNHGRPTAHDPEIILNNFTTRLGHTVGRMFASLFPHGPEFEGRQVITFHNQRDFIFVRRHRYMFKEGGEQAHLQEIGPRFTLKLQWLQKGAYPGEHEGQFEWIRKPELETSRKKFFL